MVVVGIPQGLMYYHYFPVWKRLFEENGHQVVTSDRPRQGYLARGKFPGPADLCLPVKLFLAHVQEVTPRCEVLFIPRLVSFSPDTYNCPHFLGLPDVVRATCPDVGAIIDATLDLKNRRQGWRHFYRDIARQIPLSRTAPKELTVLTEKWILAARRKFPRHHEPLPFTQIERAEARYVIGLIGRPYILYDPELGGRVMPFFQREKILLVTPEMIHQRLKLRALRKLTRPIFWYNGRENVGAAFALFSNRRVQGLIQVVTFGCGPDSLTKELIELEAADRGTMPTLSLVLDQHSSGEGVQTRLEAFIDMLDRRYH